MILIARVEEGVAVALEQRLMRVHPRAVLVRQRLRHERRVHAGSQRHLLHDQPIGHRVVRHRQRIGVAQIDLVLARRHFVMAVFDADAHLLERQHRLPAQVAGDVERR